MSSPFIFLLGVFLTSAAPQNEATELLKRYLSIRTDHPVHGTEDAANFWIHEAEKEEIHGATWSIDASRRCVHFVGYLPATVLTDNPPILLVHHGDTMPAVESEWTSPPFKPEWIKKETDWELYGRGAIDDKGHGIIHWMALQSLKEKKRSRDVYFVMNCGEEVSDPLGARAFVNFFIQPLPESPLVNYELTTAEKLETAKVLSRFPSLRKTSWIWNEGSFGSTTELKPYTLVPVATSQKGLWRGRVTVVGAGGHSAIQSKASPLEVMSRALTDFYDQNRDWRSRFYSLHYEMQEFVRQIASVQPFYSRFLLKLFPRIFFEKFGMQSMVTSWWQSSPPLGSIDTAMPNALSTKVQNILEYRFLGDQTEKEIEAKVQAVFQKYMDPSMHLEILTMSHNPFRRDFFEGIEADIFKSVFKSYPKTLVSPFITPGGTDSIFFRQAGVRAFDIVPLFLPKEIIQSMHSADERIPYLELMRGIEIESRILEKLVE